MGKISPEPLDYYVGAQRHLITKRHLKAYLESLLTKLILKIEKSAKSRLVLLMILMRMKLNKAEQVIVYL